MIDNFTTGCLRKVQSANRRTFLLAILAGMFIAFGASSSSVAVHAIENAGLAKLVAGAIFPVGLMLIVTIAGELFTGDCLMIMGNLEHKYTVRDTIEKLIVVFAGNFIGSLTIVLLLYFSGQYDMSAGAVGAYTIKVALGKSQLSFAKGITSGILCNIIVCLAVLMAFKVEDVAGKMIAVFFPIMAFVIGGFEHCVANMYYIPAGILAAGNEVYRAKAMELYGYTSADLGALNIQNFLIGNLLPVTIGNIIGGMLFVGVPLYFLQGRRAQQRKSQSDVHVSLSPKGAVTDN